MLKVYWANADELNMPDPVLLSDYRRSKLSALKPEEPRRASACSEMLLIEALRREDPTISLPLRVETDAFGKPYLPDSALCFNLSHSGPYAACAFSDRPLGLDIQRLTECREALVRRFFAPREQEHILNAACRGEAFTRLWCRKESFLKAIGLGLRLELDSFDVSGTDPQLSYEGTDYAFRETRVGELFFCVCAHKDALPDGDYPELIRIGG